MIFKKKKEVVEEKEIKTYKKYDYFWKTYYYDDKLALYYYTADSSKGNIPAVIFGDIGYLYGSWYYNNNKIHTLCNSFEDATEGLLAVFKDSIKVFKDGDNERKWVSEKISEFLDKQ